MKKLHLLITGCLIWAGLNFPAQSASDVQSDDVAVIIGNRTYADQDIPQVRFAHNDAMAMRHFVENVLNVHPDNIIYLEDATQAKMQSTFGRRGNHRGKVFQYVKPAVSNLYVFYSGHGLPGRHDQKSYLLPVDSDIETADINGYPTDLLYENLQQSEARSITVFLDACFSGNSHGGSLIKNASGATVLPAEPELKAPNNHLSILTAASKDQLASWDEENRHGLFTEYLLRALYGEADQDKDGKIKLAEISSYLNQDMRYRARRSYNRDQTPTILGNEDQVLVAALEDGFPKRPNLADENIDDVFNPPTIDTGDYSLYPVEQNMFALKNANVRRLPTVRSPRVMTLPKGEPVYVAAKIIDQPWYAVERGDGIIGYIFSDLLGEEKEIATEEENRSIRELKARLEKLEARTHLSTRDVLPQPPQTQTQTPQIQDIPSKPEPEFNRHKQHDPYLEIETTLKTMGALLARQSFIRQNRKEFIRTSLIYNPIQVRADRCRLVTSFSLHHSDANGRQVDINDRPVEAAFWRKLKKRTRVLKPRLRNGQQSEKVKLYQYGPFAFQSEDDRNQFAHQAKTLQTVCPNPRQARDIAPPFKGDNRPNDFRRPSPRNPVFGQHPPPPRR